MKVPKPRKLKSGAWNIQLRLGGESISITKASDADCVLEAQCVKAEYLAGKRQSIPKAAKEMTLSEAMDRFIKANQAVLSPSTVRSYKSNQKNRFKKYLDSKLPDIDFQKMINDELKNSSEKTVKNGWGLVHASLAHVGYPIPSVKLATVPINEIAFLQPEEIKPFCDAIKGKPYEIAFLLMLHGLRQSEVRGLRYEDIDLKKKTIRIKGAVVRGEDGMVRKKTNKNKTSTRTIPIMIPRLYEAINGSRRAFEHSVGIHPSTMLEDVKTACKRAEIETNLTCHGLRHSWASLMWFLGVDERTCMQWGGWGDIQTMHRIYIRLAQSAESKAQKTVEDFFTGFANENVNASENKPVNTGAVTAS